MQTNKEHIGILGIGAIGSVIAAALKDNSENEIYLFNRTPRRNTTIEYQDQPIELNSECISVDAEKYDLDYLFICLKEYQYKTADKSFLQLINPNTKICTIRNGINLKESLLPYSKPEMIYECIIDCPVQPKTKGVYKLFSKPLLTFDNNQKPQSIISLFKEDFIEINLSKDFKTESWKKIIESSALGSILCLTGQTCHVFEDQGLVELYKDLVKEAIKVALSDGAKIETEFRESLVKKLLSYDKDKGSSMLSDKLNGRPIEINAKNGAISKVGKANQIETPLNDLMVTLLQGINQRNP